MSGSERVVGWIVILLVLAISIVGVAFAQQPGPEALVRAVSRDVTATIRQDKEIRGGNSKKLVELVETAILPHVDTVRMMRLAVGADWRQATPEQQKRLKEEFTTLLINTYSAALLTYSDQVIEVKPVRAHPEEAEVVVKSEIRQAGAQPVAFDVTMEKSPSGWKVYDIKIGGVSLVSTYRSTFQE